MQAINYISKWITGLLVINPALTTLVVAYLALKRSLTKDPDDDKGSSAIPKVIMVAIIIECLSGFLVVIKGFF